MNSVDSIMLLSVDCVVINNEIRWVDTHWVWFHLNTIETVYLSLHLIEWYQSIAMTITSQWWLWLLFDLICKPCNAQRSKSMAKFCGSCYECFILTIIVTVWYLIKWCESFAIDCSYKKWEIVVLDWIVSIFDFIWIWNSLVTVWPDFMVT